WPRAFALPMYSLTNNPYLAHNAVVVFAFVLSLIGTYYLTRHLTGNRRAAMVSGICFAFCPYVFARLSHIQLLMTAGLPFTMLAFHRLVDGCTVRRGVVLGTAMVSTAICCGYYGVFVVMMIGFSVMATAATRDWSGGHC